MKSLRGIANLAGPGLAVCMLLLSWAAAAKAGEEVTKLTAADGEAFDHFGVSVAISGETAVIGADGDDDRGSGSGSAYVFERDPLNPANWNQTAKLTASDGEAGDVFGASVAISGETAVIGAYGNDHSGPNSGSAYVFERAPLDPANWNRTAKLTASDGEADDVFGVSVAISGDTAVIGAFFDDDLGSLSGSAYVFERAPLDPANWNQTAKLTASDGAAFDFFGVSVAISGDTAVIGASNDDDLGSGSGSAYVFERDPVDPAVWNQTAKLTASDGAAGDILGSSVAISGDTAVIGGAGDDDLGRSSGSAYVFERDPLDPAVWNQTAKLTASDGEADDFFGVSVAISGDTAVIGADADDDLGFDSGSAYVYSLEDCELRLVLNRSELRAGEEMQVAVDLHHRRPVIVTVPFLLRIEDAAGQVVAQKSSPPITMEPGDHRQARLAVTLPLSLPAGAYRVMVGVRRMQHGIAWASREFEIVE